MLPQRARGIIKHRENIALFPSTNAQKGSQKPCLQVLKEAKYYDLTYTNPVSLHTKEATSSIHSRTLIGENLKLKCLNSLPLLCIHRIWMKLGFSNCKCTFSLWLLDCHFVVPWITITSKYIYFSKTDKIYIYEVEHASSSGPSIIDIGVHMCVYVFFYYKYIFKTLSENEVRINLHDLLLSDMIKKSLDIWKFTKG